jgi:uncharacterized membrane protein YkoI
MLSSLLLVACASGGKLPGSVVEMYDVGKPGGMIEIEAERDGTIVEIEAEIDPAELPANIMEAAKKQLPGAQVTGAEYERVGKTLTYEVQMAKDGRDYEFVFDARGNLTESEKELRRNEAPKGVVEAGVGAIPGASFKSVEVITKDGVDVYHVKSTKAGASYKVIVSPDGEVMRRVREHKAEIEIPLK